MACRASKAEEDATPSNRIVSTINRTIKKPKNAIRKLRKTHQTPEPPSSCRYGQRDSRSIDREALSKPLSGMTAPLLGAAAGCAASPRSRLRSYVAAPVLSSTARGATPEPDWFPIDPVPSRQPPRLEFLAVKPSLTRYAPIRSSSIAALDSGGRRAG